MIVAAVVASIGTSKAGWHLAVDLPIVPADKRALELTLEASTRPVVACNLPGGDYELQPRVAGTTYTYLCPPRGQFVGPIQITGRSNGGGGLFCNDGPPKPPPDQFLRVKQLVPVDTWMIEATREVPFAREQYDDNYGGTQIDVRAPSGQVIVTLDAPELGVPSISPSQDGVTFNITARYRDPEKRPLDVIVHARVYGTGPKPDDGAVTIEGR